MNIQTTHKSELRPLPMRISQMQFERLQGARAHDGLSIQEHVRRALDFYLAKIEKERARGLERSEDPAKNSAAQDAEALIEPGADDVPNPPPPANPPTLQALPAAVVAPRRKAPPRVRMR